MSKYYILIAALSGAFFVGFGAYASHGLKAKLAEEAYEVVRTGLLYQIIHTLALLAVGILLKNHSELFLNLSGGFFIAGIFLFSVSLYLYRGAGLEMFAPVTPFGGISYIIGWLMLAVASVRG